MIAPPDSGGNTTGGGSPAVVTNLWANVQWSYPAAAPTPDHFDVVLTTDPTGANTADYLLAPVSVPAADRYLIVMFTPPSGGGTVYAMVRAVFSTAPHVIILKREVT